MEDCVQKVKVRYEAIDYAKAILIVLMIVGHVTLYPRFDGFFGSFRMGAFLFIAGLFCKKKEVPIKQVLENSYYQLLVPYVILSFIAFAWCWVSPYLHPELYPGIGGFFGIFKAALIGVVLGQDRVTSFSFMPNSPLWFLLGLFWCRMFSIVWLRSDSKHFNIGKFLIVIMCFLIYRYDIAVFSLRSAVVGFPFYIIGFYMREIVFSFSNLNRDVSICLTLIAFVVVFFLDDYRIYYDAGQIYGLDNCNSVGLKDLTISGGGIDT